MEDPLFIVRIVRNKMKFLLVFKFLVISSFFAVAEDFVYGLDDIPVFKEMRYIENSNVLFDKIDGRFVSSEMIGNYSIEDIEEFYISVLPNLGWEEVNVNLFQRGDEYLEIKLESIKSASKIKFSIYPK
tara:strand:- start:25 stop:411 length:387 start_codon:yes stop_codon:yes gene_type:complete